MDGTFEAGIGVSLAAVSNLKRLVIIVPAGFAECQDTTFFVARTAAFDAFVRSKIALKDNIFDRQFAAKFN
jgi:hypothetical protein